MHDLGGAALKQQARDVRAVEVVRSGQYWHAESGWFQQVVSAYRYQAATNEGDVGRRVEVQQLAQGIQQQHLAVRSRTALRAAHEAHAGLRECLGGLGEALRMARRHHQQRPRRRLA